jgi:hypothetical protein
VKVVGQLQGHAILLRLPWPSWQGIFDAHTRGDDGTNLAVEQRGNPDLILIHRLGYLFERQPLHFITSIMSSVVPLCRDSYQHIPRFALALKSSLNASGVERLVKALLPGTD